MSLSTLTATEQPPTEETVRAEKRVSELLDALEDADCRSVLEATGEEPLSAAEIVERCEIPSSTAYRKIDRLVDVGLLSERLRVRASGKHASEYRCRVEHVDLSMGEDGVELRLVRCAESGMGLAD